MQKKIITLLQKRNKNFQQYYVLISSLKNLFFKPILTEFNIQQILSHLKIQSFQPHQIIFYEGQKIKDYIFLLQGNIFLTPKSNNTQIIQQDKSINSPSIIGEYFYNNSNVRQKKAINSQGISKVIKVEKVIFDELYRKNLQQYREVQLFIQKQCNLRRQKINIFQEFQTVVLNLNTYINIKDDLYIIMKGQCLMSQKIQTSLNQLPIVKNCEGSNISKKNEKRRKLIILGQKQWIYNGDNRNYEYSVVSQKIILIKVPLNLLPDIQQKGQKIILDRIQRNKKYIQRIKTQKKVEKYQQPTLVKKRNKQSQNILNSIDSSLNPAILKQKYLLGQSKFNTQKLQKNNNLNYSFSIQQIYKKNRKPLIDEHSKLKDWSKYLKLPVITQKINTKDKDKIIIKSLFKSIRD